MRTHHCGQVILSRPHLLRSPLTQLSLTSGAGLKLRKAAVADIKDCIFRYMANEVTETNQGNGAATYVNPGGVAYISSSSFISCYAKGSGGALHGSGFVLNNVLFDSNEAEEYGGAAAFGGSCTKCNFTSNIARKGGCVAGFHPLDLVITNSFFEDCIATEHQGAAVYSEQPTLVSDSLIGRVRETYSACNETTSASDSKNQTCSEYSVALCNGQYDDADFSSADCCVCGGGSSFYHAHDPSVIYHADEFYVLWLNRVVFADNNATLIDAEFDDSVVVRNCDGLDGDTTLHSSSILLGCASDGIEEFCNIFSTDIICSNSNVGIEVVASGALCIGSYIG